jgi:hypothetical protein
MRSSSPGSSPGRRPPGHGVDRVAAREVGLDRVAELDAVGSRVGVVVLGRNVVIRTAIAMADRTVPNRFS